MTDVICVVNNDWGKEYFGPCVTFGPACVTFWTTLCDFLALWLFTASDILPCEAEIYRSCLKIKWNSKINVDSIANHINQIECEIIMWFGFYFFAQNRCVETLMLHAWWRSTCVSLEATTSQYLIFTLLSMKSSTVMGKTVWSLISAISDATTDTLQSTSTLGRRLWFCAFNCVIVMRSTPRCCQMSTFSTIKTIWGRLLLRLLSTTMGLLPDW